MPISISTSATAYQNRPTALSSRRVQKMVDGLTHLTKNTDITVKNTERDEILESRYGEARAKATYMGVLQRFVDHVFGGGKKKAALVQHFDSFLAKLMDIKENGARDAKDQIPDVLQSMRDVVDQDGAKFEAHIIENATNSNVQVGLTWAGKSIGPVDDPSWAGNPVLANDFKDRVNLDSLAYQMIQHGGGVRVEEFHKAASEGCREVNQRYEFAHKPDECARAKEWEISGALKKCGFSYGMQINREGICEISVNGHPVEKRDVPHERSGRMALAEAIAWSATSPSQPESECMFLTHSALMHVKDRLNLTTSDVEQIMAKQKKQRIDISEFAKRASDMGSIWNGAVGNQNSPPGMATILGRA